MTSQHRKEYLKIYNETHKDEIHKKRIARYWARIDAVRAYSKRYYREHKEQEHARAKKYNKLHPEKARLRKKLWRLNNPEKYKAEVLAYRKAHPDKLREFARKFYHRQKAKVFAHYGNKCVCCGESHKEFLCIDHINGGGTQHRKSISGNALYPWIVRNNFPPIFRVLCQNCNSALGHYGYCPHHRNKETKKVKFNGR